MKFKKFEGTFPFSIVDIFALLCALLKPFTVLQKHCWLSTNVSDPYSRILVARKGMEESKLQAIADSLSGHGGRKGLGTYGGDYSWSKSARSASSEQETTRTDGLPTNALYSNFVKAGGYDPSRKGPMNHGDGRIIKRDFSDIPVIEDSDSSKKKKKVSKEERKAAKKAAKLEAKRQARLEEKRLLKKASKLSEKSEISSTVDESDKPKSKKRKRRSEDNHGESSDGKPKKSKKSKQDTVGESSTKQRTKSKSVESEEPDAEQKKAWKKKSKSNQKEVSNDKAAKKAKKKSKKAKSK